MHQETFLQAITKKYLEGDEFNGFVLQDLKDTALLRTLESLLRNRLIDIITQFDDPNPHVKRYPPPATTRQLNRLLNDDLGFMPCAYPTSKALQIYGISHEPSMPYTSALRSGATLLQYRAFELSMLERFRKSGEYRCDLDNVGGTIWYDCDSECCDVEFKLGTQGQSYVTASLLRLSQLVAAQQKIWRQHEAPGQFLASTGLFLAK